jgi:hypothetical protein
VFVDQDRVVIGYDHHDDPGDDIDDSGDDDIVRTGSGREDGVAVSARLG